MSIVELALTMWLASHSGQEVAMSEHVVVLGKVENPHLLNRLEMLEPRLAKLAESLNVAADCYEHGYASWKFIFRHPRRGAVSIQLSLAFDQASKDVIATIQPFWWIDDYSIGTRRASDFSAVQLDSLAPETVVKAIYDQVRRVLESDDAILLKESRLPDGSQNASPTFGPFNVPTI
jgi:hypothetical protein